MSQIPHLLSLRQAYKLSGLSTGITFKTFQNHACRGDFVTTLVFGRRYVDEKEFAQWLKERKTPESVTNINQWRNR